VNKQACDSQSTSNLGCDFVEDPRYIFLSDSRFSNSQINMAAPNPSSWLDENYKPLDFSQALQEPLTTFQTEQ
jgi:hypothetical protein